MLVKTRFQCLLVDLEEAYALDNWCDLKCFSICEMYRCSQKAIKSPGFVERIVAKITQRSNKKTDRNRSSHL